MGHLSLETFERRGTRLFRDDIELNELECETMEGQNAAKVDGAASVFTRLEAGSSVAASVAAAVELSAVAEAAASGSAKVKKDIRTLSLQGAAATVHLSSRVHARRGSRP